MSAHWASLFLKKCSRFCREGTMWVTVKYELASIFSISFLLSVSCTGLTISNRAFFTSLVSAKPNINICAMGSPNITSKVRLSRKTCRNSLWRNAIRIAPQPPEGGVEEWDCLYFLLLIIQKIRSNSLNYQNSFKMRQIPPSGG